MPISLNGTTGAITGMVSASSTDLSTSLNAKLTTPGAWTAFTPTLTANTGTFTSASAAGAFTQIGKTVICRFQVSITTNGTAAGSIILTLPVNRAGVVNGFGRENAVTGKMLNIIDGVGQTILMLNYDNSYPGGNGHSITAHVIYEAA